MNGLKVAGGYGSLIASILIVIGKHFGLPVTEDQVNYLSGILAVLGGGLLHIANPPKK